MIHRKLLAGVSLAMLAAGSAAFGGDQGQSSGSTSAADSVFLSPQMLDDTTTAPSTAPAASAPSQTTLTPLMLLLDPTPVGQWLEKGHFNITGYVDAGTYYNASAPGAGNGQPTFIFFPGQYPDRFLLDQVELNISKTVDTSTKNFDWGFMIDQGYGVDDSFIHSHGMLDNSPPGNPNNQYDITQAFLTLFIPVGNGVTLKAGKFVTLFGNETINPLTNQFYTHSYNFSYGIPFTQTGVLGTYVFSGLVNGHDLTLTAGITEGWNQSLRDNNGAIDFLGEASFGITDKLSCSVNLSEGPEAANNNSDYWTVVEVLPTYAVSDQLSVTGDFLYGDFPNGATTPGGNSAQWYGAAVYGGYKLNGYVSFNLRTEWYRDQGAYTTGFQANYYEASMGPQIHPLPNDNIFQWLQFRPEFRVDWADRAVYNSSNPGAANYSQLSFAVDAIMQF